VERITGAFHRFEDWLAGWPNSVLTAAMLLAALALVVIALRGKPRDKAIAMAYVLLP
jgi:hypothetical protein